MARHWVRSGQLVETTLTMADGDTLLIERIAGIRVRFGPPAVIAGRDIRITNDGEISSDGQVISASGGVTIINQSRGIISGGTAPDPNIAITHGTLKLVNGGQIFVNHIDVDGTIELRNKGAIGDSYAASGASDIRASGGLIINAEGAMIGANTHAIVMSDGNGGGASAATIVRNAGMLTSRDTVITLVGDQDDLIVNTGTITRKDNSYIENAIDTGGGNDRVVNHGTINGSIFLGDGDDVFISTGFVNGIIYGGAGDDRIIAGGNAGSNVQVVGGLGRDVMTGGEGSTVYYFDSIEDSSPDLARADVITNIEANGAIYLRGIDADITQEGHQRFTNIGAAAFSGTAGELRIETRANFTAVLADVDGDAVADFAIRLTGQHAPADIYFYI